VGKTFLSLPIAQALNAESSTLIRASSTDTWISVLQSFHGPAGPGGASFTGSSLPHQPSNAAQFLTSARQVLDDVRQRGKRALIVQGAVSTCRHCSMGLCNSPPARLATRAALVCRSACARRCCTSAANMLIPSGILLSSTRSCPSYPAFEVTYLTGEPFLCHRYRQQGQAPLLPYVGVV